MPVNYIYYFFLYLNRLTTLFPPWYTLEIKIGSLVLYGGKTGHGNKNVQQGKIRDYTQRTIHFSSSQFFYKDRASRRLNIG